MRGKAFPRLNSGDHTAVIDAIPNVPPSGHAGFQLHVSYVIEGLGTTSPLSHQFSRVIKQLLLRLPQMASQEKSRPRRRSSSPAVFRKREKVPPQRGERSP